MSESPPLWGILKRNWRNRTRYKYEIVIRVAQQRRLGNSISRKIRADPLVGSIATQFLQNREEHDRIARLWTKRYAT
ncbi:Ubiquitin-conjugating enzyme E2 [Portunus trituberculatus]|uniref:Ubiquitin-conjugating enzyme E2 n=1 Tax=Portunus trituberculatus TaxID=210409 RepID=A0A5B7DDM1_PORTR|nr:Ubiquitin-conjugating enzyme E2 [Portunus trituberculatus]